MSRAKSPDYEAIKEAITSEQGYKGYRLQWDELLGEWLLEVWSKTYGWDYPGGQTKGSVRSYKNLDRGVRSVLNEISKRQK